MSIKLAETLVDAAARSEPWSAEVEAYLDAHPLSVNDDDVARIVARLHERRPAKRSPHWLWAGAVIALAAAVLLALNPSTEQRSAQPGATVVALPAVNVNAPMLIQRIDRPGDFRFSGPQRTLWVHPDTVVLTAEDAQTAVILVQEGTAESDGTTIPALHWAVLRRVNGVAQTLVFRDGEVPDALNTPQWQQTTAPQQLEELRWQSLPERSISALERLLEK